MNYKEILLIIDHSIKCYPNIRSLVSFDNIFEWDITSKHQHSES